MRTQSVVFVRAFVRFNVLWLVALLLAGCSRGGAMWSVNWHSPEGFAKKRVKYFMVTIAVMWKTPSFEDNGAKSIRITAFGEQVNVNGLRSRIIGRDTIEIVGGALHVLPDDVKWDLRSSSLSLIMRDKKSGQSVMVRTYFLDDERFIRL